MDKKYIGSTNFKLTDDIIQTVDRLRQTSGVPTRAEVMRKAIKLYDLVLKEQQKGNQVIIKDGRKQRELMIL